MSKESRSPLANGLAEKLQRLFAALIISCVVLGGFRPVMDNVDLGWHVAQGRWMVEHAALYTHDVLNYPNLGHAGVDEYPLFQVVLFAAWSLGWWGPCLLTAAAYALLTILLLRAGRNSSLAALSIGLMLLYLQSAAPLRPHLVTYLCVTVLGIFLLRQREATKWTVFWPMALMQIAWTNSHSAFVLGPAMTGLFGAEITIRQWLRDKKIPWQTARVWQGAFLLIFLACFVNPWGVERFYPPFYQDRLESIRAYVGEMWPLDGGLAELFGDLTLCAVGVVVLGMIRRHGAISWSFLLLAVVFYFEALAVRKAWPVFGLFVPLLVLSSGALAATEADPRRNTSWLTVFGYFVATSLAAVTLCFEIQGPPFVNVMHRWSEYSHGRTELPTEAVAWMKEHGIAGRLFQRSEYGGFLQQEGYDHGETFSETGFGKYDEAFIHENGLVQEHPARLPRYLAAYQPDFVVCNNFCYLWPYYLKQSGWRVIFYSPNSSVWTRPGVRMDLPTVLDSAIIAAFDRDIADYGLPANISLFGRNLVALNSYGLEDAAFARLKGLPEELHHASWYWQAAQYFCFYAPRFSDAHQNDLRREAEALHEPVTNEFLAYCDDESGDVDGALKILDALPPTQLDNGMAELLLKIDLERGRPGALALAERTDCWDLRNARHWQYLAQAEEQAGHSDAAARAWEKAVFYNPDDAELIAGATAFAAKFHDAGNLSRAIAESTRIYGKK